MKQPDFWKHQSFFSIPLAPFAAIYSLIYRLRCITTREYRANIPVICLGNVTIGGAGKTPSAIEIGKLLINMGKKPVFLSRGYGGNIKEAIKVNLEKHTSTETGDEPLLLARIAPTIISRNRTDGAKTAEKSADVIIMDDGLQNPSIHKDLSILVIDGTYGIGNGHIIPSGPLRETLSGAIKRCAAIIFIGDDKTNLLPKLKKANVLHAKITPHCEKPSSGKNFIAFAGIANTEKFFNSLKEHGYNLLDKISFSDHYQYNENDLAKLRKMANEQGATLITTEKDLVRLNNEQRKNIETLPIKLEWNDESQIKQLLEGLVQ